jgi:3-hydroxyacyl-CoA dehydrogenase / enoyl-CoA hydratase / 3-hydroxybutyryl-CoA epimerase
MSQEREEATWRWEGGAGGIRTLWFDQPGTPQNFIDASALDGLEARLIEFENDPSARGLVIKSAKPAGFCSGADLQSILSCRTPEECETFVTHGRRVLEHLSSLCVPTVAVIHGSCLGAGIELALACRRRVAMASAAPIQVGVPEVHFGLIPAWGAITQLPRLIGPEDGLNLLITGRTIGYLLARSQGFVDRLASEGDSIESLDVLRTDPAPERNWPKEVWEEAWNCAREKIEEQPGDFPEAQLQILTIVSIDLAHGREAARQATAKAMGAIAMSQDVRAAMAEFFDRRLSTAGG